ncbi:GbsR/MarR family transcriptional regulator [Streptoalloteichus tenebrarius]|nr:helix-turn-helix domain-containing protein [Streptoalloteichus tenebrarius]
MSDGEAEFVDRVGLFFESLGAPRTMGRIYGWLMICDPPDQSLTALARTLSVSKASVSTTIRPMSEGGLVERVPVAGREHHYRIVPGGLSRLVRLHFTRVGAGAEVAAFGLSVVDEDRAGPRERLAEFRDFCEFTQREAGSEFVRRWAEFRTTKGSQ